ncbi:hypothetical protein SAMN05216237_1196 [Pseudomonas yamanorum]|nr:hypothetical protein SAMN05216237_1196 [Pseudomonas yamanorum]
MWRHERVHISAAKAANRCRAVPPVSTIAHAGSESEAAAWNADSIEALCATLAPLLSSTRSIEMTVCLPLLGRLTLRACEYKPGLWLLLIRSTQACCCQHLEQHRDTYEALFSRALDAPVYLSILQEQLA